VRGTGGDDMRTRIGLLRALQSRNYRLYLAGQTVSFVGTWMQQVAMSWLIYRMTGSAMLLGVIGFAAQIPIFLLAPGAGVLADRVDRRWLLLATQALAMIQATLLALLYFTHALREWHVIVLAVVLGVINAFDIPIRQAFVVELVSRREELPNAIALNSCIINASRLVGPTVAGVVVAAAGEGTCFVVNAASYVAVLVALSAMRTGRGIDERKETRPLLHDLEEGYRYCWNFIPVRALLMLLAATTVAGVSYAVLLPVMAKDAIGGGASTYGFLSAASGAGALVGTVLLAARRTIISLGSSIFRATLLFGIGIALFAFSSNLAVSIVLLALIGYGSMVQIAGSNTIVQTIVKEEMRGRTMSFFTMSLIGTAPFGSLLAGYLAEKIGPRATLVIGGVCCVISGVVFARRLPELRRIVRPIYRELGIIPEVSTGLKVAAAISVPPEKLS
jgi:MFS family permease